MRVNIEITAASNGQFANIFLCYTEPETRIEKKVQLKVHDFTDLHDFTNDTSSLGFDFFLISAIVYGIDDLFSREKYSFNGWTREFEVQLPVNNIDAWTPTINCLNEALTFLTGDYWSVSFSSLNTRMYVERANRKQSLIPQYDFGDYEFASLFSGGLDSLIGVIDELTNLTNDKKGILISHSDGAHPGSKVDQERILPKLERNFQNSITHLSLRVGLSNTDQDGNKIERDSNQRSRSILFLGIATYIINIIPNIDTLILPENGTISLNHPLTPSRSSSLSTRTTHPYFIEKVQKILSQTGISICINNPYSFKTKGEMVFECLNEDVLTELFLESASCGKRGHTAHWDIKNAKQCGVCMPCIYRRASLHKLNLDNEVYGKNLLNHPDPIHASPDMPALFDYLKTSYSVGKIKRNLLVNGSISYDSLNDFANVVVRSRGEILSWIRDKGSQQLKTALGIR
ncbi:MAG: hypothetical protein MI810_17960 [Flavobacteriales bacterium]|nr:hypothetical protein [Flavobacteriales bacterium]